MTPTALSSARLAKGWSQMVAAKRLGVSQPYLAMLERGQRRLTLELTLRAVRAYGAAPTAVPPSRPRRRFRPTAATLATDLAGLGYPGFAYLRSRHWKPKNPGDVLLSILAQADLEPRAVEALPWLVLRYSTLDWTWVVQEAKLRDLQNRLGFVVSLARRAAERVSDEPKTSAFRALEREIEHSRLAREDTLCRASMPEAERRWLMERRSEEARHWNLVTDWTVNALRHVA